MSADLVSAFLLAQNSSESLAGVELPDTARLVVDGGEFERGSLEQPVFRLSPVGISDESALVFIEEYCGSLCGGGFFLVLRRAEGGWILVQSLLAYIS